MDSPLAGLFADRPGFPGIFTITFPFWLVETLLATFLDAIVMVAVDINRTRKMIQEDITLTKGSHSRVEIISLLIQPHQNQRL
jgi:hypothetical protein